MRAEYILTAEGVGHGKNSFAFILCAAAVPAGGLVAYYPCSESVANLAGTHLRKDTAVNVTFASDRFGNPQSVCAFDGETSYFSVPGNDAFSIVTQRHGRSAGSWVHIVARYDLRIYSRALPDNEISAFYSERDPAGKTRAAAAAVSASAPGVNLVRIH